MDPFNVLDNQWQFLLKMLPPSVDLDSSAREHGAILRKRVVTSGELLLRLALVYSLAGFSLRQTAAWACEKGLATLSDVALLNRLRGASDWLGWLLAQILAERTQPRGLSGLSSRLRLVDATTVSRPGSKGTDWRVHLGLNLTEFRIDSIELTGPKGGETLTRFSISPGDLVVGDRGYAHRRGVHSVRQAQGHFLVRFHVQNLPVQDREGNRFDVLAALRQDPSGELWEFAVQIDPEDDTPALPARLIVVRKSAQAAEHQRAKIRQEAARKGRQPSVQSLEAAGYFMVLTSMPEEELTAQQALEIYRFRWQIEMKFKRLKGVLALDELAAKDPRLAQTFLLAKLVAALLLEDLSERFLDFSPWGYPLGGAFCESLAD